MLLVMWGVYSVPPLTIALNAQTQLDRGDRDALSEGDRRCLQFAHRFPLKEDPAAFPRQIDTGLFSKAKALTES